MDKVGAHCCHLPWPPLVCPVPLSSAVPFTGDEHKKNQSHVIHRLMSCGEGGGNAVAMVILLVVSFHLSSMKINTL